MSRGTWAREAPLPPIKPLLRFTVMETEVLVAANRGQMELSGDPRAGAEETWATKIQVTSGVSVESRQTTMSCQETGCSETHSYGSVSLTPHAQVPILRRLRHENISLLLPTECLHELPRT
jgi:hypothetical protein